MTVLRMADGETFQLPHPQDDTLEEARDRVERLIVAGKPVSINARKQIVVVNMRLVAWAEVTA